MSFDGCRPCEVEALFGEFLKMYDLASSTPPLVESPTTPHECRTLFPDPPLATANPPATIGRLIQSGVDALLRAVAATYGLPSPPPDSADPELSPKIRAACRVARENGYRYIWIDSCCIDKSSSSELSEAINSMYKWYGRAAVCYAYLADVPPGEDHQAKQSRFHRSRWFKRGWTLQELIAPVSVEFLSQDWAPIGSKHTLADLVENITKIHHKALLHAEPLHVFSIAQRLSWAAERRATTGVEDQSYSLLGIFDINMPTIYGEGDRAFRRLQEQIMQRIPDHSLFAWGDVYLRRYQFPLNHRPADKPITLTAKRGGTPSAESPAYFKDGANVRRVKVPGSHHHEIVYTLTSYGIRTQFHMIPLTGALLSAMLPHPKVVLDVPDHSPDDEAHWYLAVLGCEHVEQPRHLLGRVCYTTTAEPGVDFVYAGFLQWLGLPPTQLFLLSPQIIEDYHQLTELKTVYISHPTRANVFSSNLRQPYTTITLVLLRDTRDALRCRGYSADLRDPDPGHPTGTHWLTLSNDEHTITIAFQHALKFGGRWLTITAEAKISGSRRTSTGIQLDSTSDSESANQADRHTVSWSDSCWWTSGLPHRRIELSTTASGTLTSVDLGLYFAGGGHYLLHVDVVSAELLPASSLADVAGEDNEFGDEDSLSRASGIEKGSQEEADRGEIASVDARDTRSAS